MDCVNHSGVPATAYCQNCGKALCAPCVRNGGAGQIFCEPCFASFQTYQQPFVAPPPGLPNPSVAAVLGLIPGVGAMYNGQYFKGLIHVVIFVVMISISTHYGIFGIFIGAWVLYQSFEAFHTAKALRDGTPLPDPLGLNEVGNWLNLGGRTPHPGGPTYPGPNPGAYPGPNPVPNPGVNPESPNPGAAPNWTAPGTSGGYATPYTGQYQAPYSASAYTDPVVPPAPPVPPLFWRRKEPIGALVLIGFGLILLLNQMGYMAERFVHFLWPLIFIALGVWLILRRVGDSKGGTQ
jgi:TM2 domain-containing membrane protein YozV